MSTELQILVTQRTSQSPHFRIAPPDVEAAIARASQPLPPLRCVYADPETPDYVLHLNEAFAIFGFQIPIELLRSQGRQLRLIQLNTAGIEHLLPLDWLPRQVALATVSGIHIAKLRDWAGMVFMMLHAQMPYFVTAQRRHLWSKAYCSAIHGKRALIYGTGSLGAAVAAAARGLGIEAVGVRRNPAPVRGFGRVIGMEAAREEAGQADFVVLTMPLTPSTRHVMNADMFARLRPGCGFANFGRGGLVDQPALIGALSSGQLGGAVIDVAEPEPLPPESPLWDAPNLIITPHVSCDDPTTFAASTLDLLLDNIVRRVAGRPLRNRVVPSRAY